MDIFYSDKDRKEYLFLLNQQAERAGLKFVSYCLMMNHIHLLVIPYREDSLRCGIGEANRLYTRYINFKEKTRGYLFQGRFFSCPWTILILLQQLVMLKEIQSEQKYANLLRIINGQVQNIIWASTKNIHQLIQDIME